MSSGAKNYTETDHNPFMMLEILLGTFFYKPDLQAIRTVLGTIKAHYLDAGDPAWLFAVAPPGTGKTTISIMGACGLPQVVSIGALTENCLLSGFYGAEQPGLLEQLGYTRQDGNALLTKGDGIFLIKDFTTVLSMHRDKRAAVLSYLREIHDGEFRRSFGTGETKIWRGRLTIIAAVTPVLDRHYTIFNLLGERFLQVRWHRPDSEEAGVWAIEQQGQEKHIRQTIQETVRELFSQSLRMPPTVTPEMRKRIAAVAEIVALGRAHILRNSYGNREIEYVPEPEANTRISKGLASIAMGIAALNQREEVAEPDLNDVIRVGFDCLPEARRRILLAAIGGQGVDSVAMPRTVRNREVEELQALDLLDDKSKLNKRAKRLLAVACPETFPLGVYHV